MLVFVVRVVVPEAVAVEVTEGVVVLVVEAAVDVAVVVIVNKVAFALDLLLVLVVVVMVVGAECGDLFFCERSWRSAGLSCQNFFITTNVLIEYDALFVDVALVAFTENASWWKITIFVWLRGSPFVSYTTASGFDQQWTSETQHRRRLKPADIGTKRFPCKGLKSFISVFWNVKPIPREATHSFCLKHLWPTEPERMQRGHSALFKWFLWRADF